MVSEERTLDELCRIVSDYCDPQELDLICRAYRFAANAHEGQFRKSGEPYITHPLAVANILAELQVDCTTIVAGLLHDVVEDTPVTDADLVQSFGSDVAALVDGVTKLKRIKFDSREEQQAENLRKMFMAMARDIRVLIIKLADRLHNMRTLKYQPPDKQLRTARETLEIFAPLAHRLGIYTMKWELEDVAFRYLNPTEYYRIVDLMAEKRKERERYIEEVMNLLRNRLSELDLAAEVSGRAKHIYSIYRKMITQNKEFNEIYDLFAVRVTVESIKDCYGVLGVVHTLWKPMPGRFKDYIAMPKANMYQSLHTTVIGPRGEPLEIQIRTWEMHQTAEFGIAAHWVYKEDGEGSRSEGKFSQKLAWFREVLEWQQDFRDAQEFMETLKIDLFADEVFVFTPKGDVYDLPAGSVPIDFAYRVHTDIGNRCTGARVNGKMVPLDYRLRTGDIVEILTTKTGYGPSRDWLKIVKSSQAKSKIRQWFKREKRDENIARGREVVERELVRQRIDPHLVLSGAYLTDVMQKFSFTREEDLYAAVGYGGISAGHVVTRLVEKLRKEQQTVQQDTLSLERKSASKPTEMGVRVRGVDNMLIRFARCCHPVPGDAITGFVTRGRGVSVHREDCPNVKSLLVDGSRQIDVEWASHRDWSYHVALEVTAMDRHGLINEMMNAIAETKTDIMGVSARVDSQKVAHVHLDVRIRNLDHLRSVTERLKRLRDTLTVHRVTQ
ncbi:MAG: bifunctional (p)ppGpp synthetase/guanosine-3',5'-bis(diphosphate) 3'-pyrophosphohydrolase [Alicyclobacillaceae bacterium]|jgi:GTP pyrophosphokinase|uniref:RelA/SpoT family protein n=1 Tax=Alicyclobacillus sp. SP_1 TaxID=2942475 RepID=UPI002158191D|nr:bifunctional (p)ppGpp synthetase/guanosine-3',5'-bis(diphosphate) 3'-pyrophosphohydrolase [Alicyclobacillus sp. SP_1]MCY0888347.1 bifunctional (p)ppGpp synthetase/guanosine-3',5'-bis(diphosphate) 3'-pyrophosphohydrolase [Alicyclobacillaceae bacterium]MCY0895707.1 bifunctional (p)ppGpp synthetase/guanosine-3',5'-bis(diphosphate) 3'-pyrophosphohydrolase [Alicyclobacillaceae bacterium]